MNILPKPDQAAVPVNQPKTFPTFHLIPETGYVRRRRRAANQPAYQQQYTPSHILPPVTQPQGFIARQKLRFHLYCAATWSRLKEAGRNTVRWLVWRVLFPLACLCTTWVPFVNPADLT